MTRFENIRETCEIRKCPVTGRRVIVSTMRMGRPYEFISTPPKRKNTPCPFCPGNESETPPEVIALRSPDSKADSPGWSLRVIPNKFPALLKSMPEHCDIACDFETSPGLGIHEVVIETNRHDLSFSHFTPDVFTSVIRCWRDRITVISKNPDCAYVQLFKNSGALGGASILHAHSQILSLPFVPELPEAELSHASRRMSESGKCIFCELLENDATPNSSRFISASDHFAAITPYAGVNPFECWIFPRAHQSDFRQIGDADIDHLADDFVDLFSRYRRVLGDDFPFNLILHTAPATPEAFDFYHWHFELYPQMSRIAGFERGTGVYVNAIPPEYAAEKLREV